MTVITEATEGRALRPRALIVTVYGAYGRDLDGWISVADLIALMSSCGVDEPAVRSSISRLKRRGILTAERRDGTAGYSLSELGRGILTEGDHRIFERHAASLDDGWVLAVFSVPESEREKRHTLRSKLTWLGFGNASSGVWIAPAHLYDEVHEVLVRLELTAYVNLFRADYRAFADLRESVASWWDLESLRFMYNEFLSTYSPVLARWSAEVSPGSEAFADYIRVLTDWRRLPFLDPGLPPELLPADWPGDAAADLFARLEALLHEPGLKYVTGFRAE